MFYCNFHSKLNNSINNVHKALQQHDKGLRIASEGNKRYILTSKQSYNQDQNQNQNQNQSNSAEGSNPYYDDHSDESDSHAGIYY